MGEAYITHGRDDKCVQSFGRKIWRKDLSVSEDSVRMIPEVVGWNCVGLIDSGQNMDLNKVMNICIP
jgi:hypothetical protein